jgi:hypothetical protein
MFVGRQEMARPGRIRMAAIPKRLDPAAEKRRLLDERNISAAHEGELVGRSTPSEASIDDQSLLPYPFPVLMLRTAMRTADRANGDRPTES